MLRQGPRYVVPGWVLNLLNLIQYQHDRAPKAAVHAALHGTGHFPHRPLTAWDLWGRMQVVERSYGTGIAGRGRGYK